MIEPVNFITPFNPVGSSPVDRGGGFGAVGDFIGDLGDLADDVGGLFDDLGIGGGSSGSGGFSPPVPIGTNKLRNDLLGAVEAKPTLKAAFVNFLRSIQVADSWLQNLTGLPTLSWPAFVSDLLLIWLDNERPASGESPGGFEVRQATPQNLFGPSSLPIPGGGSGGVLPGIGIPELNTFMPISMPAVPVMTLRAKKGYSIVTNPMTGEKIQLRTDVARALKLIKPRKKAPIKGSEWDAIKKAYRFEKKIAGMLNKTCGYKAVKKTSGRR